MLLQQQNLHNSEPLHVEQSISKLDTHSSAHLSKEQIDPSIQVNLPMAENQDFNRLVIQLFSVLEFAKEDSSDPSSVVKLFEQSLLTDSGILQQRVSIDVMCEMLECLLKYMADNQASIQFKDHTFLAAQLLNAMHAFFTETNNSHFLSQPSPPKSKPVAKRQHSSRNSPKMEEANEIIMKVEMKKFQNLVENRIRHKNSLLKADVKRLYPMNKLMHSGFTAFLDQKNKYASKQS